MLATLVWLIASASVTHQEDLIGTFAERGVVRTVHGGLAGEFGVKLAGVISWLLRKKSRSVNHILWKVKEEDPERCEKLTRKGLNGGSTFLARSSSQFICLKNGWAFEIQKQQPDLVFSECCDDVSKNLQPARGQWLEVWHCGDVSLEPLKK